MARQDYAEFAKFIGTGAQMSPANLEAQRLCADLFFAFGRPLDSYQLLEESLEFAKRDREHVRYFVQRCQMMDQDARVMAAAARLLPDAGLSAEVRAELELAKAQALFIRGDYPAALAFMRERGLTATAEGYLLHCQTLWESGDRPEAWKRLEEALSLHPSAAPLLEMKARWHKEAGNLAAARDCLELLAISAPTRSAPVVQSLYLLPGEANRARREQVVERCLREFGGQEQAMLDLARFGNDTADTALTERMLRHAESRRFPNRERFVLVHVECMINAGRVRETILTLDELPAFYNEMAAGLVLSMTKCSLLPLELLACGCVPVVNDAPNNRLVVDNPSIVWISTSGLRSWNSVSASTPRSLARR
ncbi:MAG: hypothetical protein ACKOIB_07950, partial [Verrucomicrobiota bacterium]